MPETLIAGGAYRPGNRSLPVVKRMHEGFFRFKGEGMSIIRSSLAPEAGSEPGTRTKTEIRLEDERTLLLHVRAADISAFRAALNMWLRLISVAEEMQEIVKHG